MYRFPRGCTAILSVLLLTFAGARNSIAGTNRLIPGQVLRIAGVNADATPQPGTTTLEVDNHSGLRIVVVGGENGHNIIQEKSIVKPVIEVRDSAGLPVRGALVTFTSPDSGPTVDFGGGLRTATVVTDAGGQATIEAVRPRNAGSFRYEIAAHFGEQTATAQISQTNFTSSAAAARAAALPQDQATSPPADTATTAVPADNHRHLSNRTLAIIIGVAGAAAAGLAFGVAHASTPGSGTANNTPTAVIGTGTGVTAGAPH